MSSVGFNTVFYYPHITSLGTGKTLGEYIYSWDIDYYLEEKLNFLNTVQKQLTSNYISNYNKINQEDLSREPMNGFNEIYIDNVTQGGGQFFYVNEELYEYSIYSIILDNSNQEKEHVLSIIL